jgi:hypothetical protein
VNQGPRSKPLKVLRGNAIRIYPRDAMKSMLPEYIQIWNYSVGIAVMDHGGDTVIFHVPVDPMFRSDTL